MDLNHEDYEWTELQHGPPQKCVHAVGPKKWVHPPMNTYGRTQKVRGPSHDNICSLDPKKLAPPIKIRATVHTGPICEDVCMVVQPVECTELQMMRHKIETHITHPWKYSIGTNLWRYMCVWWLVRPKKRGPNQEVVCMVGYISEFHSWICIPSRGEKVKC